VDPDPILSALSRQASDCERFGSPFYAGLLRAAVADLGATERSLFARWEGLAPRELVREAVALRFLAGLHDLALEQPSGALADAFPPAGADPDAAWRAARAAIERCRARLAAFMDHEPQTNEVRRSACLLPGFLTIAAGHRLPMRCFELGASAGLNQLWSRFRYRLGACGDWGDPGSPLRLETDWRGAPPPLAARPIVVESAACDRAPVDLKDPAQRRRLTAYIWPDQPERLARLATAIAMALDAGIEVERADAAHFCRTRAAPRPGTVTVIYHSIFQQYLPPPSAAALHAAIAAHGAAATAAAPLAWLRMEPAEPARIELTLTSWPGGRERRLALVHAHGAWIDWTPEPSQT